MFSLRAGRPGPEAVVNVPRLFAKELADMLRPFATGEGRQTESSTERMLGKAGRLAYIVPTARPFVTGLWGALAGAHAARQRGKREAPPDRVPARRFKTAALWLLTLLEPPDTSARFPLEQVVCTTLPQIDPAAAAVFFDASPWGCGAFLVEKGRPTGFFEHRWSQAEADSLDASIGKPKSQTTFEYLALLLVLMVWADRFSRSGFAVLGDNVSSLSCAVSLKGKGPLSKISREIAWRTVRRHWRYSVAHVPSESNEVADALSRLAAPSGSEQRSFPTRALRGARRYHVPHLQTWWPASA